MGVVLANGRGIFADVASRLTDSDFSVHALAQLFRICLGFDERGEEFDLAAIMGHTRAAGGDVSAEAVGVVAGYTGSSNLGRYIALVKEASLRRELRQVGGVISRLAVDSGSAESLLSLAQSEVMQIGTLDTGLGPRVLSGGIQEWVDKLDDRVNSGTGLAGISTGFRDLDRKTGGLEPGDLVVIAGRPSMGKTSLAIDIGMAISQSSELSPVCMFSMEMGYQQILSRAVARQSRVSLLKLRTGAINDEEWRSVNDALADLPKFTHFLVDDTSGVDVQQMRSRARRLRNQSGKLALIVIDYVQLMSAQGDTRASQVAEITRGVKAMGKDLGCPVVLLSQLNREVEKRQDKRPMMSDLKESGAIEQDADLILFVYRDVVYNAMTSFPKATEIIIAKQRNGPTGTLLLYFDEETASFGQMDQASQQLYWDEMRNKKSGVRGYG